MRRVMKTAVCGAACVLLTGVLQAAQGVVITARTTTGAGAPESNTVQIEPNRMRADVVDPSGAKTAVMVDTAKGLIDIVNFDKKSYIEITKAQMEQMAQMMNQMMAAMASMPPEQKAQMESMMRGRGMGMAMPGTKTEYKKTGTDRAGKWTCDKYEGYEGGQKVAEVCTVNPTALGLSAADIANVQQLADSFKSLVPSAANSFGIGKIEEQGYAGMPIKSTRTVGGQQTVNEVVDVTHQNIPESAFVIPADFQKQDMGMGNMGGMGRGMGRGRGN